MFADLENEVKHGIVSGQTGAAVSFCREITDIDNYLGEYRVTAFTETEWNAADERWQRVEDSKQLLDSVKVSESSKFLPPVSVLDTDESEFNFFI